MLCAMVPVSPPALPGLVRLATVWLALALAVLVLAASAALGTAPAHATVAFEKSAASFHPTIWVAEDNGAGARRLATLSGEQPLIAPDGSAVIFQSLPAHGSSALELVPTAGGALTALASPEVNMYQTAWSPDSKTIVTALGTTPEHERLVLIDVATRSSRVIARGNFQGVSFSPDSTQLAYSRAPNDRVFPTSSDIYTVPVAGGTPLRITSNQRSTSPVWGPTQIAFARSFKARARREDAPKSNVWLMSPDGSRARQLTRQRAPFLLSGPAPLAWSASGAQLLAEFGGQDTSYGEGVNPSTGAVHTFSPKKSIALQLVAAGISRDGSTVLGATGGFDPSSAHNVVTVPFAGGPLTVVARNAFAPSWNG
jgi:Tol biopolymer transport system component